MEQYIETFENDKGVFGKTGTYFEKSQGRVWKRQGHVSAKSTVGFESQGHVLDQHSQTQKQTHTQTSRRRNKQRYLQSYLKIYFYLQRYLQRYIQGCV